MAPRQRIRLREVRKSDFWDDQRTPAEIDLAESLAVDEQDLLQYLLSQVRQIIGTQQWHNPVPVNLTTLGRLSCSCTAVETVGSLVHISGNKTVGLYTVRKSFATTLATMPVMGLVVSKPEATLAEVQYSGVVSGIWTFDLVAGKPYFLGKDGEISLTPPTGPAYVQKIGVALDVSALLVTPDPTFIERRA